MDAARDRVLRPVPGRAGMRRRRSGWRHRVRVSGPLVASVFCAAPALADRIIVRGPDPGVVAETYAIAVEDGASGSDPGPWRAFYGGRGPTVERFAGRAMGVADLVPGAAHLVFLRRENAYALGVVYRRARGIRSVQARLEGSGGALEVRGLVVRDAAGDRYAVRNGALETLHRMDPGDPTAGYVAVLGAAFSAPGDVLSFGLRSPAPGGARAPLSAILVYGGEDPSGAPIWIPVDAGPFPDAGIPRIRFRLVADDPSAGGSTPAFAAVCFALALVLVGSVRFLRREPRVRRRPPSSP